MSAFELTFPERPQRDNRGRFIKGHQSPLKGVPRSQWMDEQTNRRLRRILTQNLLKHHRDDCACKPVVGIKEGKFYVFPSEVKAAKVVGVTNDAISACVRGKNKTAAGYKWFLESDPNWMEYYQNQLKEITSKFNR